MKRLRRFDYDRRVSAVLDSAISLRKWVVTFVRGNADRTGPFPNFNFKIRGFRESVTLL